MADRTLNITVGANIAPATEALRVLSGQVQVTAQNVVVNMNRAAASTNALGKGFGGLGNLLLGGAIIYGLQRIGTAFLDFAKDASNADNQLRIMANTARNLGHTINLDEFKRQLIGFANSSRGGGYAIDEMRVAAEKFAGAGLTQQGIMDALALTANVAASRNLDYATAAQMMAKAVAGNVQGLQRLGIVLKDHNGNVLKGADAIRELSKRFHDDAQIRAASLEGQLGILDNRWKEFKELLGAAVIPTVLKFVSAVTGVIQGFEKMVPLVDATAVKSKTMGDSLEAARVHMTQFGESIGKVIGFLYNLGAGIIGFLKTVVKMIVDFTVNASLAIRGLTDTLGGLFNLLMHPSAEGFKHFAVAAALNAQQMKFAWNQALLSVQKDMADFNAYVDSLTKGGTAVAPVMPGPGGNLPGEVPDYTKKPGKIPEFEAGVITVAPTAAEALHDLSLGAERLLKDFIFLRDEAHGLAPTMTDAIITPWEAFLGSKAGPAFEKMLDRVVKAIPGLNVTTTAKGGLGFAFSPLTFLIDVFQQTRAFGDIMRELTGIVKVFAKILDGLRPVIDLLLRALTMVVNGLIFFYNTVVSILRVLGIHLQYLQTLNDNFAQLDATMAPFVKIVHDIPTASELASGNIAPLSPGGTSYANNPFSNALNAPSLGGGIVGILKDILAALIAYFALSKLKVFGGAGGGMFAGLEKGLGGLGKSLMGMFTGGAGFSLGHLLEGAGLGTGLGMLVGGSATGSGIGSVIGSVIGSFIPGLGTVLGGVLGGLFGGLFGHRKPAAQQNAVDPLTGISISNVANILHEPAMRLSNELGMAAAATVAYHTTIAGIATAALGVQRTMQAAATSIVNNQHNVFTGAFNNIGDVESVGKALSEAQNRVRRTRAYGMERIAL